MAFSQAITDLYAAYQAGKSMDAQADVAAQNAQNAALQGNAKEELVRRDTALQLGEQRASVAQSGFEGSTGSFAALQAESAGNAELDALTTRYQGQMKSLSFKQEEAGLRANAKTSRRQGWLNAAGSLASSGGQYGGSLSFK